MLKPKSKWFVFHNNYYFWKIKVFGSKDRQSKLFKFKLIFNLFVTLMSSHWKKTHLSCFHYVFLFLLL